MFLPWQQKPGKKTGKPGEVWFNQAYQAFGLKSSLVKSLVSLVYQTFLVSLVKSYLKSLVNLVLARKLEPEKPGNLGFTRLSG